MMKPLLELKNYPHDMVDILKRFEAGQCLSPDQLHFITDHEKALSDSTLDPIIRYYLTEHIRHPHKALPLELPHVHLNALDFQQVRHNIHLLLKNHLSHVDLEMTNQQFLELKAQGLQEVAFWHGNQFLPGTLFQHGSGIPYRLYFQWGRMFGVVKFHLLSCGKVIEGRVLIYLENMQERSLKACVKDYEQRLKEEENLENTLILQEKARLQFASPFKLPSLKPGPLSSVPDENTT